VHANLADSARMERCTSRSRTPLRSSTNGRPADRWRFRLECGSAGTWFSKAVITTVL